MSKKQTRLGGHEKSFVSNLDTSEAASYAAELLESLREIVSEKDGLAVLDRLLAMAHQEALEASRH